MTTQAKLNQIATYSPINTYLAFSQGTSRAADYYGYPIMRATDANTGQVFKCMGGGYDMWGTNLGSYLYTLIVDVPEAKQALAEGVYQILKEEGRVPYGINLSNTKELKKEGKYVPSRVKKAIMERDFRIDGGCGESSMRRIAETIGLTFKDDYIRARTRKGTDKFQGTRVELNPKGRLVKLLAKKES